MSLIMRKLLWNLSARVEPIRPLKRVNSGPYDRSNLMKRSIILTGLVTAFVALSPAGVAFADNPHNTPNNPNPTGQPNQSLQTELANGGTAPPGLQPSNPNGFNTVAVNKYANPTSSGGVHSGNPKVVSQYDVAAFQVSQPHP